MSDNITLEGKLLFPSEYVGAIDLKGKDVPLTIAKVEVSELRMQGGSSKKKPVIHFEKTEKKLVLNKTNARIIAAQHGPECLTWVGKRIILYPTKTRCGGQTVDCVRVRESDQQPEQGQL